MLKTVSYSEARNNLKTYLDYVADNNDTISITRQNGDSVILISQSDFNSINETLYLLSSANNRKHLREAIKNKGAKGKIILKSKAEINKLFSE